LAASETPLMTAGPVFAARQAPPTHGPYPPLSSHSVNFDARIASRVPRISGRSAARSQYDKCKSASSFCS